MKLGYLGPIGSNSERAALYVTGEENLLPLESISDVIKSVNSGKIEYGIVPIENSTEGTVNITVDSIIFDADIYIQKEVIVPIEYDLFVKKGAKKEDVKKIISHPQALAQCRNFLEENYPSAKTESVASTSLAAKFVSACDGSIAAVSAKRCADIYDVDIIEENIQDSDENYTEFVVISKNDTSKPIKGHKTSIAFSTANEPGTLFKVLSILAIWDLNMTRIVSRPMRNRCGEYVFYIDIYGEYDEKDMCAAFERIENKTSFFKILGSYPIDDHRK
ncbi:MAG: prephenate dehydratase [Firmicutes bacterium]|nr:prephenate dehydratase [Bacillota bacterium]